MPASVTPAYHVQQAQHIHLSISEGEVNSIITEPGGVCPSDQLPRRPAAHELQLGYPQLLSASSTPALLLFAQ